MGPRKQATRRSTRSQIKKSEPVVEEEEQVISGPTTSEGLLQSIGITQYVFELIDKQASIADWIQWFVLVFVANVIYVLFNDKSKGDSFNVQYLYDSIFTLLCVVCQVAVVFHHLWKKYKVTGQNAPQLPELELIYAVFIPLAIALMRSPRNLVLVAGSVALVSDLQELVKIGVSVLLEIQLLTSHESIESLPFVFVLAGPVWHVTVTSLLKYVAPNSFSKSERNILGTLAVALVLFINTQSLVHLQILQKLMVSFSAATGVCYTIYLVYENTDRNWAVLAILQAAFYGIGVHLSIYFLIPVLKEHPFLWLQNYIQETESRWFIFQLWLCGLFIVLPSLFIIAPVFPLDVRRKVWHFILFAALSYPLLVDPQIVALALIGLFGLLLLVELQRALRIPPFGNFFQQKFTDFLDEKDIKGEIVSSYLFLVLGVALPIWLDPEAPEAIAGLVTVGLGDSFASLLGKRIGANCWPGTKKTVEGSVAFVTATAGGLALFKLLGQNDFSYSNILCTAMLSAMVEGCTTMNDNLLVPIFTYLCLTVFKYF
ncbi:hypothetical protein KL918_001948 [Ogataea parapolymorpha]|uniref:dolichol kinase n=1 Tax=Ogataea parapolymorpha (strain ATCC 26012 / BCRC 20466 / JCM 22074 / NRRL Y-7560 / DL-1) TaxID=871575 RepID=W1QDN4_OGAPD|nr:dolichol kinase [Ogataea parapolymorpha DL-1]ESW98659.1 dolichol kinase [Ogataea parapolymorpha DL-1]KAG7868290.1 hypothetical protein KL918_001948 [Ogataea parapolymorpha]KAG7871486.1 hypothetical protein KL916_004066 [Ogataea parapolymorpha]